MADIRNKTLRNEIKSEYNFCCAACGCADRDALEIDHVDPQSNGGSDKRHNLQVLCMVCNKIKGNTLKCVRMAPRKPRKNSDDWYAPRRNFRKHIAKLRKAG